MKYNEYLVYLQKKYSTSNTEILQALNRSGGAISKSNLSHKLSGERSISIQELEIMIETICPSSSEEYELRRLYRVFDFGENNYEEFMSIKNYIEHISDPNTVRFCVSCSDLDAVEDIRSEQLLINVLFTVLESAWQQKKPVRIFCQPQFDALLDMISSLSMDSPCDLRHLVCINNDSSEAYYSNNMSCLFAADRLSRRNPAYQVRFYYSNADVIANRYTVFPFYIVTEDSLVLVAPDFKSGFLCRKQALIRRYLNQFDLMFSDSKLLLSRSPNEMEFLRDMTELETLAKKEFFVLNNGFSFLNGLDIPTLEKCLLKNHPYRDEILDLQSQRIGQFSRVYGHYFHIQDNREAFMKDGVFSRIVSRFVRPVPPAFRSTVVNRTINSSYENRLIHPGVVEMSPSFVIACYDNGMVLIAHYDTDWILLESGEKKLYQSVRNFFQYLMKYESSVDR